MATVTINVSNILILEVSTILLHKTMGTMKNINILFRYIYICTSNYIPIFITIHVIYIPIFM